MSYFLVRIIWTLANLFSPFNKLETSSKEDERIRTSLAIEGDGEGEGRPKQEMGRQGRDVLSTDGVGREGHPQ